MADRRSFLKKLGIGSIIIGTTGIFSIDSEAMLNIEDKHIKPLDEKQLIEVAGSILDAVDGRNTNSIIYNYIRTKMTEGTYQEAEDFIRKDIEKNPNKYNSYERSVYKKDS